MRFHCATSPFVSRVRIRYKNEKGKKGEVGVREASDVRGLSSNGRATDSRSVG